MSAHSARVEAALKLQEAAAAYAACGPDAESEAEASENLSDARIAYRAALGRVWDRATLNY